MVFGDAGLAMSFRCVALNASLLKSAAHVICFKLLNYGFGLSQIQAIKDLILLQKRAE